MKRIFDNSDKNIFQIKNKCPKCRKNEKGNITKQEDNNNIGILNIEEEIYIFRKFFFNPVRISHHLLQPVLIRSLYQKLDNVLNKKNDYKIIGEGRKLLTFTDNRQKAAKLASRLEWIHENFLQRAIIYQTIKDFISENNIETVMNSLKNDIKELQKLISVTGKEVDIQDIEKEIKSFIEIETYNSTILEIISSNNILNENFKSIINKIKTKLESNHITIKELIDKLKSKKEIYQFSGLIGKIDNTNNNDIELLSKYLTFREFSILPKKGNNLENLGIITVDYDKLDDLFTDFKYNQIIDKNRTIMFTKIILDIFRSYGIVEINKPAKEYEDIYYYCFPKTNWYNSIAYDPNDDKVKIKRFRPQDTRRKTNNYLKIAEKFLADIDIEPIEYLDEIWNKIINTELSDLLTEKQINNNEYKSYKINLDNLVFSMDNDIYQCESCGKITTRNMSLLNNICTTNGCDGKMYKLDNEKRKEWFSKENVLSIINLPLIGMSTSEHTAQIGSSELESNEEKFINGEINLLSSSTTMELGIDIGELTAVYLSNCPPGPSNYLQRAGRVGRRLDGTSIVLTNARKMPYDQLIFKEPDYFFTKKQIDPYVSMDSEKLIIRHLNAFIFSEFFSYLKEEYGLKIGNNVLSVYGKVGKFFIDKISKSETLYDKFLDWSRNKVNDMIKDRYYKLTESTSLENIEFEIYIESFIDELSKKTEYIRKTAGDIQNQIQSIGVDETTRKRALEYSLRVLTEQNLINYFAYEQIFPKYCFPIDVIKLNTTNYKFYNNLPNTRNSYKYEENTRLERKIDIAISEYAPGSELIVNKRKVISAGISFNSYNIDYKKEDVEIERYVICENCDSFFIFNDNVKQCPVCNHPLEKSFTDDDDLIPKGKDNKPKSSIKEYLKPKGFAVDFYKPQKFATAEFKITRRNITKASLNANSDEFISLLNDNIRIKHLSDGEIISINQGKSKWERGRLVYYGYCICLKCGKAEEEKGIGKSSPIKDGHHQLRKIWNIDGKKSKECHGGTIKRNISLLGSFKTDTLQIRFDNDFNYRNKNNELLFYRTLAKAIVITGADILGIDSRELNYIINSYSDNGKQNYEIIIYDNVDGGAGYSERLSHMIIEVLKKCYDVLDCDCEHGCPKCIYTYEFEQENDDKLLLDRKLVYDFLKESNRESLIFGYYDKLYKTYQKANDIEIITNIKVELRNILSLRNYYKEIIWYFKDIKEKDFEKEGVIDKILNRISEHKTKVKLVFNNEIIDSPILNKKLEIWKNDYEENIIYLKGNPLGREFAVFKRNNNSNIYLINHYDIKNNFSENPQNLMSKKIIKYNSDKNYENSLTKINLNKVKEIKYINIKKSDKNYNSFADIINRLCKLTSNNKAIDFYYSDRYIRSKQHLATIYNTINKIFKYKDFRLYIATIPIIRYNSNNIPQYELLDKKEQIKEYKKLSKTLNIKLTLFLTKEKKNTIPGGQHRREILIKDSNNILHTIIYDPGLDIYKPIYISNNKLYDKSIQFIFNQGDIYYFNTNDNSLDKRINEAYKKNLLEKIFTES